MRGVHPCGGRVGEIRLEILEPACDGKFIVAVEDEDIHGMLGRDISRPYLVITRCTPLRIGIISKICIFPILASVV